MYITFIEKNDQKSKMKNQQLKKQFFGFLNNFGAILNFDCLLKISAKT